ncbi:MULTISPECIES: DUF3226 domain-containing protein [unclassified Campylobacter]|uniref:DUF3226 domain-containing protein n=1 Tax=unclassified Campylobacter TaxID=2593542 RepID=UPI0022EA0651|nr:MULTISPECIES: DUF3226 domain-containing protein [unclassified Campylobacter]MDA3078928.1 hypothetical protein [Campylobacter sp. CS_NA2]MDA3080781.1 hypothetical protein [Campylobacter sp. CS_NA1]MDA3085015.1 hypothetical protein [Campylobacter sp. CS_ED1]MDA3089791.1 hypothetical protein [Campylobacter sp. CS_ED2]WBR51652.1 hypothetical protein PF026_02060 [Campylobacter sp. CS_NA3]
MKLDGKTFIFVEGKSDKYFLEKYVNFLNSQKTCNIETNIETCNGKDNLKMHLPTIENVINRQKVVIIFDADDDLNKAKANIKKQLGDYFDKVEIFLFPNNKKVGCLEDLIEKIATKKENIDCFKKYLDCIKQKNQQIDLKNVKKSTIYAYLEAVGVKDYKRVDFNNQNYFDLSCGFLKPLKKFLENL